MNKYFIYARKSSDSEDRQVLSIDAQIKELKEFATRRKLNILEIFSEAKSAKDEEVRPAFAEMIARIRKGEAQGIICWKLDRLARNGEDGGKIIGGLRKGWEIVTPSQVFNKDNENGLLMWVEFGMADQFINDLSKNVKRGLKAKAEKGWLPSGAKPGYENDKYAEKGNKTVKKHPTDFVLIRRAWDKMLTGLYSPPQVLRMLNDEWGYRTPRHKKIGGKPMSRSKIYTVFTDPFYYGEFEYQKVWYKGNHEPMITKEEFDRVQKLLGNKGRPRPSTKKFDYTGLMRCGECKATITAEEKDQIICPSCRKKFASGNKDACPYCNIQIEDMKNPTFLHYVYYHCTKQKNPKCTQGSIELAKLETQIDELLGKIQISERFQAWAVKQLNRMNDREVEDRNASLMALQRQYSDVVKRLDNLLALKISPQNSDGSLLSDDEYKTQKGTLMKEKDQLQEKLGDTDSRINRWQENAEKMFEFATYARYWYAEGGSDTKRKIMASLGSNLELLDKIVRITEEKPIEYMIELKTEEDKIYETFEPEKGIDKSSKIEDYWAQNSTMLRD